jgi:hypothetical protein
VGRDGSSIAAVLECREIGVDMVCLGLSDRQPLILIGCLFCQRGTAVL